MSGQYEGRVFLIVGLGNPGPKFERNRHNAGFIALDTLCNLLEKKEGSSEGFSKKFGGLYKVLPYEGGRLIMLKPQECMNLSGNSVLSFSKFFKVNIGDIFVLHDELDIPSGKTRFKIGGGNAGHNGLKSIDKIIGAGYSRMRIGIGRPEHKTMVAGFVLSDLSPEEIAAIKRLAELVYEKFNIFLEKQFSDLQA